MKDILVFIDFSETSRKALDQAASIAQREHAALTLCHVYHASSKRSKDEASSLLASMATEMSVNITKPITKLGEGDFFVEAERIVAELKPDLVVAANHGVKSLDHRIFGSAIHKLVQQIEAPTLLINEAAEVSEGGFKNIMLPAAPHPDFHLKVEAAASVLAPEGKILLFVIIQPGQPLDPDSARNMDRAKEWLTSQNVKWEYREVDAVKHAIGYADQTLRVMGSEQMDLIAIMARISDKHRHFGKIDKERVLLNEEGFQVLCANGPAPKKQE